MQDAETKTLWNHITGEAVHGPLLGRSLGPLTNLLHMTVRQALNMDAGMRVAISGQRYVAGGTTFGAAARGPAVGGGGAGGGGRGGGGLRSRLDNPAATMAERFAATLGAEDTRRPRMEIGLGVWIGGAARYYPLSRIRERGEVIIDRLAGRTMLVYIERESNTPAALFVNAGSATRDGQDVRLDDGSVVRGGVLRDARGRVREVERPHQIFTRWYGFAITFPATEIFGG